MWCPASAERHVIARLVWHATEGRRNRGWRRRFALIRRLASAAPAEFEAWRTRALHDHLEYATPGIVNGIRKLIESFVL